ncbi:invasin domain 3-containing protein, partial [Enterobacter kobei]|uniref:invasin domain 3-containing protein n=1 Tax=Enterobacter kobei TaxID=208224 RepID=UPI003CF87631
AGEVSEERSTLTATPPSIKANGSDSSTVTLTLHDANDNPVSGQMVTFAIGGVDKTSLTAVSDNGDGTYTAALTGAQVGEAGIKASVNGTELGSLGATVTLLPDSATAQVSSLSTVTDNAIADGVAQDTVKAVITDSKGNPLEGMSVGFSADHGATIQASEKTDKDGVIILPVTNKTAGKATITATLNASTKTTDVHFVAGEVSEERSTLTATPPSIKANGSDSSTVTLTLHDANDNPVSGKRVWFKYSNTSNTSATPVTDNGDGTYTAVLQGVKVGEVGIKAVVNGLELDSLSAKVTVTAGEPYEEKSHLTATPRYIMNDGIDSSVLMLTLHDANGNPVSGQSVTFVIGGVDKTSLTAVSDNGDGTYTATLTGTQEGEANITVVVNGQEMSNLGDKVTLSEQPKLLGIAPAYLGSTHSLDPMYLKVGFKDARFTLLAQGKQTDFLWSTNQSEDIVTVDTGGVVTLHSPTSEVITITAKRKSGLQLSTSFSFSLDVWLFQIPGAAVKLSDAESTCNSSSASLLEKSDVLGAISDWGSVMKYGNTWTSTSGNYWVMSSQAQVISMNNGVISNVPDYSIYKGACRIGL